MNSIQEIVIIKDGSSETIRGEKRADNIYYCLESPVFIGLDLFGCEVEVKEEDGKLKFVRIHKESAYVTHVFTWSKDFLESGKGVRLKKKIVDVGGDWEQVMGGMFFIHLPKEKDNLLEEILRIVQ